MQKYKNILSFYEEYIKLEQIIRKGWIMRNIPAERIESVSDHTLQLIMLANIITKELAIELDNQKLIEMLLIHDLGEVIIGDISEVEENRDIKKAKEAQAVMMLCNKLSDKNAKYYYSLWAEMENQNTSLAKFAYLLDKIDAIIKAGIYEKKYNMKGLFKEFSEFQKQKGTFKNTQLEELFNFLESEFKE